MLRIVAVAAVVLLAACAPKSDAPATDAATTTDSAAMTMDSTAMKMDSTAGDSTAKKM